MNLYYGMLLFLVGQTLAWFQSNSGIITEENATKAMFIAAAFAPYNMGGADDVGASTTGC